MAAPFQPRLTANPPKIESWPSRDGRMVTYVFPSMAKVGVYKPISREAIEKVYRTTLGLKNRHSPHGWRAAFSTLAKEKGYTRDAVELALDHVHDSEVVRAYDRGARLAELIKLMKWWGAELIKAEKGH
jgi:integrase